ncbi:MAG: hypothetical protein A2X03_12420 [Bacteroidetes bacterium GWA2_40_15]|nr:MAG: hypothetical protein A2X03_12420 [Bacteroidetes bacterium GWA2_40_15]OFY00234.1 MAG: hypothetical protein A2X06_16880 [Bacteroidetes bacterium GWC2_40_22]HBH84885.1 polysaccharide deacetylase [Bacteroidales bacterium]HBQ83805.1 polysaccharide deacetylase [Bacteroidales bacterium]HCU17845.1 polysaccharide deacetylase [Bacteroidales bacterium]
MKKILSNHKSLTISLSGVLMMTLLNYQFLMGQTEITKWQYGKSGAVSITYDDGSINQFRKAVPIMNRLNLPGTFFINTGNIPGSEYQPKFIGRPVSEIISEAGSLSTNKDNFYERASAARFLGYKGTSEYFSKAGAQLDAGKDEEAYKTIDELYRKVNKGELPPETERKVNTENTLTWEMIKTYAAQGHEFASHTIGHPYLGVLDEPNMLYELEKSREDILNKLGPEHTFSAETPYCSQDKRVLEYTCRVYPAVRSSLTDEYFQQIRFLNRTTPVGQNSEYVQWQRGTYTRKPLQEYKAWVDTTADQQNVWLVLVIHGLDGIGWESVKSEEMDDYFRYIRAKDDVLWIATYRDVTKYIRERKHAEVKASVTKKKITVSLTHTLDKSVYNFPLTIKTVVSPQWKEATVKQGSDVRIIKTVQKGSETYVLYQAMPNAGIIEITR